MLRASHNASERPGSRTDSWDWIVLAIQVGFAVIFTAIAALIAHSRLAANDPPAKKKR